MIEIDHDRRQSPRIALRRPCKVFNPRSGRYASGSTCDVSTGGMLLRLERAVHIEVGDRLYVGVAQKRRQTTQIAGVGLEVAGGEGVAAEVRG